MNDFIAAPSLEDMALSEVVTFAEQLADRHMRAPVVRWTNVHARIQELHQEVFGNLAELIAHLPPVEPPPELGAIADWLHDSARSLDGALQRRADSGCIRECHGSRQAANIVRGQGSLTEVDDLELEPREHGIDVMDDLACLVMDLTSYGRADLAFALLSRYLEITGDYDGVPLLPFYAVHHALLQAKGDTLTAEQSPSRRDELNSSLRRHVSAAAAWITPRAHQFLILMHGPSGSGKSWLSERLVARLSAIRLSSDLERKRLAGITPQLPTKTGLGLDSTAFTHRTYERLADCARHSLQAGLNTIIDAAFLDAADRELFRQLAARFGAACVILSCRCDAETLVRRMHRSRTRPTTDLSILSAQLRNFPLLSVSERAHVVEIDTSDTNAVPLVLASIAGVSTQTSTKPAIVRCSA